jgi:hypothetical protein
MIESPLDRYLYKPARNEILFPFRSMTLSPINLLPSVDIPGELCMPAKYNMYSRPIMKLAILSVSKIPNRTYRTVLTKIKKHHNNTESIPNAIRRRHKLAFFDKS